MGYTTKISDYELERGDGPEPCEGYDVEAEDSKTKSKVVSAKKKPDPETSTTAVVKDAKSK